MHNFIVSRPERAARRRKLLFIGAALLVVTVAAAWFFVRRSQSAPAAHKTAEKSEAAEEKHDPNVVIVAADALKNAGVTVVPSEIKPVADILRVTGSVGPNETRVGHLYTIARGRIQKVYVRLGDQVREGQPLVAYDNIELGELVGQYGIALAALKRAEAVADVAKRALERAGGLVDLGAVARAEYERRRAEQAAALSEIGTQRAELASIEEKLHRFGMTEQEVRTLEKEGAGQSHRVTSQSLLTAPFSGVITAYNVAIGETVETSKELFTLADLSVVWVQADVFEKDIAAVRKGQTVQITTDAYPGQKFSGRITYISDFLDPKTRTAKVRCEVNNADGRLKLDMFVALELPNPTGRSSVMVPFSAIQQVDDKPVAFVRTGPGQFQARELQTGVKNGDWIEVKSGIREGEPVVNAGSFTLKSMLLRERIGGEE